MTNQVEQSVVISGASSFTGTWLCKTFAAHGWKVTGLCSQSVASYQGLKRDRLKFLAAVEILGATAPVDLCYGVSSEDGSMTQWILNHAAKGSIWVHHHHWMENFRSPQYDVDKSNKVGIAPLRGMVAALKKSDYRGIIFSGSYFEPGEGGNPATGLETPYSKSKKIVWENLLTLSEEFKIPLSKVIIPDPVGPLENDDRLIPTLVRVARGLQEFKLMNPKAVGDHVPVDALAEAYVSLARALLEGDARVCRPSGWFGSTFDWIKEIDHELLAKVSVGSSRISDALLTSGSTQNTQGAPVKGYTNREGEHHILPLDWMAFWQNYAQFIKTGQPWS